MLAALRQNSRSVLIYVLFGVIIAVFILSFGPGSRGVGANTSGANYAAEVAGSTIAESDFRLACIVAASDPILGRSPRTKQFVMDRLIERELLADEGERLGFQVSEEEVNKLFLQGRMLIMGSPRPVENSAFKNGVFDYDRFRTLVENLGVSVVRFIEIEKRELLADKVRELLKAGAKTTPDEVKSEFEQKGRQVNLEYVRFAVKPSDDAVEPSAADLDAYIKAHDAELKKQYEERGFMYKKLDKQVKISHILIPFKAAEEKRKPGTGVAKVTPEDQAHAKEKADKIVAKLNGGAAFAELAKSESSDEFSKKRGGLLGWKKKSTSGLGDGFENKIFAAKKGELLGPEKTERGYEIIKVQDFREGDVPVEAAEREMAEEQIKLEQAKKTAKAEADGVLARVQKGEKLDVIVPKSTDDKSEKNPDALKLKETGLFARRGEMVGDIGLSKELAKRAFELKVGEVAGPFEVGNAYVVVREKERKEPDMVDFEKRKGELEREAERNKWRDVVSSWSQERCVEIKNDGRIKVNGELVAPDRDSRDPRAMLFDKLPYQPCGNTRLF